MKINEMYSAETIGRAKDVSALEAAARQFGMAMNAKTPGVSERALNLACSNESKAFAA